MERQARGSIEEPGGSKPDGGPRRVRISAVIAVAIAVAVVLWLALGSGGGNSPSATRHKTVAAVSEQGLRTLAGALNVPMYWEGPEHGVKYELTRIPQGATFVRYLPEDAAVGTRRSYPFVATFPMANAFARTSAVASKSTSVRISSSGRAVAFYPRSSPTNAYLAFPGSGYHIEVFDPDPVRMRALISSGAIQPVNGVAVGATAVTLPKLEALPAQLGHPVYWVGTRPGTHLELRETDRRYVYVRYLPVGAKIGTSNRYLFVATFPVRDAFAATSATATKSTSVKLAAPGGAVAFYMRNSPTNAYVAFPGASYQIEIFDPNPQEAHALITSGRVRPIP
jgi:hypothetical protein